MQRSWRWLGALALACVGCATEAEVKVNASSGDIRLPPHEASNAQASH